MRMDQIEAVVELTETEPPPEPLYFLKGVANIRDERMPIIDLKRCLRMVSKKQEDERKVVIVVNFGGRKAGVLVDKETKILNLLAEDISPPPTVILREPKTSFVEGVVTLEDRLLLLLNIRRVLTIKEIGQLRNLELS